MSFATVGGDGATKYARFTGRLVLAVPVVITLLPPLIFYVISHGALDAATRAKAEVKAEMVMQLVTATPDLWQFQEHRLRELLVRYPVKLDSERASILDTAGNVLVETDALIAPPTLRRGVELFDAGKIIGRVDLESSLRGLVTTTALLGVFSLLFGAIAFGTIRTLRKRARFAEKAWKAEHERARITLHAIGDGVITTDADEFIEYLNPVAERLTGWTLADAVGQPLHRVMSLIDEINFETVENPVTRALRTREICELADRVALVQRDGATIAIDDSAAPIIDANGVCIGAVLVFHDVTVARSMTQRITWAATHDALTGLVNRREFETRTEAALVSARGSAKQHVLCYLDLDQFKIVNDTSGHAAGDALLKQIAALLQDKLRESDTLARLGGDEFGVLLDSCPMERAELIAADLLAAVRNLRFNWEGKSFTVGVSIGLVEISADTASRTELFSAVDAACYSAKEQGRNRVCVYQNTHATIVERRKDMDWTVRLRSALEEDRFVLYYQPYRALDALGAGGMHVEILLRLVDEEGNLVAPGNFIPAAERYNLMHEIDNWVIKTAFSRYHDLVESLGAPLICAINLSGTSLNGDGLLDHIREQACIHSIPPGAVCFEITETAAINNLRRATQFIKDVKALGFYFALDDFGSGTSSFGYLKNLPVDYLKIDGSFVQDMANDPLDRAMTETINRVGHIMGLKTVAEFAENDEIIAQLKSMGVDFAQGYGVQKPRPLPLAGEFAEQFMSRERACVA